MALAEAQAMGLPVVSSQIGGIPEAVADERTGFLTPQRNSEALAKKLLILLQDEALWTRFSNAGRDRIGTMFNLGEQTSALENIYEHLLCEWASKSSACA